MGSCSSRKPTTVNQDNKEKNVSVSTTATLERAKEEFERKYAQPSSKTTKIEDFQLQKTITMTTFGRIMLVKRENQLLSLKIMKKEDIVQLGQVTQILSEKSILQAVDSRFIVNFICAFKDNANLYLTFEYISGGDMFSYLHDVEKYPENQACFYAAQIVLAFEYLHNLNILYRNLKTENTLFAADGYLKLFDFEFAKVIKDRTHTLCGTPDYLAPEIILGQGHNKSVDYWALGIFIYEMTTGSTPFMAEDPMEIYKKILKGTFLIPDYFSSDLTDLVNKLLQQRPTQRYGCLKDGIEDIKNHKWFSLIDWTALGEKRLQALYIPQFDKDYYQKYDEEPLTTAAIDLYPDEFAQF